MGVGNQAAFAALSSQINQAMDSRIQAVNHLFVEQGREMLNDFRTVQYAAPHEPYKKGSSRAKRTVRNREQQDADMGKAIAFAQANAGGALPSKRTPWINRTFRGARGVHAYVNKNETEISIGLYHTMAYGAYLEFAHNRKYAVLEPIVRERSPILLQKLKKLLRGKR